MGGDRKDVIPNTGAKTRVQFGADLWKEDVEQYDKVCKVEPFQRGLKTLQTGVMLNGRRRDHGDERAYIDLYENAPIGGGMAKVCIASDHTRT